MTIEDHLGNAPNAMETGITSFEMVPTEGPGVSSRTAQLWAKTGAGQAWHPLGAHIVDAVLVGKRLWSDWLSSRSREWLSESFGGDEERGGAFFSWLAGCHDLGKASPAFQIQVEWLAQPLRDAGFDMPNALPMRNKAPHALVSAASVGLLLNKGYGWPMAKTTGVASILGGHHGWFPSEGFASQPRRRPELYGWSQDPADPWMTARRELLDLAAEVSGARNLLADKAGCDLDRPRELAFSGFIVLADWISSNEMLFPYTSAPFTSRYVEIARHYADDALGKIGWQRWSSPKMAGREPDWFDHRFGFAPNAVQKKAVDVASLPTAPGLMFIEAPMGVGKTEAALGAVEMLASGKGLGGVFVGLPTQATSNQMFVRTTRWLEKLGPGTFVAELAHGKAHQVEAYRELRGKPSCIDCDGDHEAVVTAEEWFGGSKRRLLAPFVVGTVDQVLMSSAKVRHVALRQVGLIDKVVVVDEVHAYDAHMSVFLRRALRWLGAVGVPVLLLTATLPPRARQRLTEAYVGGPVELGEVGYPSITTASVSGDVTSQAVALDTASARVQLAILDEEPTDPSGAEFIAKVSSLAEMGANILVVRNTVDRAQSSFKALAGALGPDSVRLLHARFMSEDRLSKEQWLVKHFGPRGSRPTGHVVVGTQVLEQSLDVDFDALVTDIAPIDLVLQRVGRVWRHAGVSRPRGLTAPLLVVAGMKRNVDAPPEFPNGARLIYGEHLLLRTAALLGGRVQLEVPGDVPQLITKAYGDLEVVPMSWSEEANVAALNWAAKERAQEAKADQFAIPEPDQLPNLLDLCRFGIDGNDDDPAVQAAVRDSDVSVEVVLGWPGTGSGVLCAGVEVPLQTRPEPAQVQAALSCTLRLPSRVTQVALDLEIPAGWQEHPWLRRLRVVKLSLDGEARIGKNVLRYSEQLGLEMISDA